MRFLEAIPHFEAGKVMKRDGFVHYRFQNGKFQAKKKNDSIWTDAEDMSTHFLFCQHWSIVDNS